MNKNYYIENISTAISLIAIGITCLLVTLGVLDFRDIITFFFRYWPALLIFAGIKLIVEVLPFGKFFGLVLDVVLYIILIFGFLNLDKIESFLNNRFGEQKPNRIFFEIKDWKENR